VCSWICARQNRFPCVCRNIIQLSNLQHWFRGTLVSRKTCSGVTWVKGSKSSSFFRGKISCFRILMRHYKNFRSLYCIQTPSRPVSYTGGWVQLIAEKEILIVVASLVAHCCGIQKNVIVASQLYDVGDVQFTVEKEAPLELLQFIQKHNLGNAVKHIVIMLRIFLKLPLVLLPVRRVFRN